MCVCVCVCMWWWWWSNIGVRVVACDGDGVRVGVHDGCGGVVIDVGTALRVVHGSSLCNLG